MSTPPPPPSRAPPILPPAPPPALSSRNIPTLNINTLPLPPLPTPPAPQRPPPTPKNNSPFLASPTSPPIPPSISKNPPSFSQNAPAAPQNSERRLNVDYNSYFSTRATTRGMYGTMIAPPRPPLHQLPPQPSQQHPTSPRATILSHQQNTFQTGSLSALNAPNLPPYDAPSPNSHHLTAPSRPSTFCTQPFPLAPPAPKYNASLENKSCAPPPPSHSRALGTHSHDNNNNIPRPSLIPPPIPPFYNHSNATLTHHNGTNISNNLSMSSELNEPLQNSPKSPHSHNPRCSVSSQFNSLPAQPHGSVAAKISQYEHLHSNYSLGRHPPPQPLPSSLRPAPDPNGLFSDTDSLVNLTPWKIAAPPPPPSAVQKHNGTNNITPSRLHPHNSNNLESMNNAPLKNNNLYTTPQKLDNTNNKFTASPFAFSGKNETLTNRDSTALQNILKTTTTDSIKPHIGDLDENSLQTDEKLAQNDDDYFDEHSETHEDSIDDQDAEPNGPGLLHNLTPNEQNTPENDEKSVNSFTLTAFISDSTPKRPPRLLPNQPSHHTSFNSDNNNNSGISNSNGSDASLPPQPPLLNIGSRPSLFNTHSFGSSPLTPSRPPRPSPNNGADRPIMMKFDTLHLKPSDLTYFPTSSSFTQSSTHTTPSSNGTIVIHPTLPPRPSIPTTRSTTHDNEQKSLDTAPVSPPVPPRSNVPPPPPPSHTCTSFPPIPQGSLQKSTSYLTTTSSSIGAQEDHSLMIQEYNDRLEQEAHAQIDYGHYHGFTAPHGHQYDDKTIKLWSLAYAESRKAQTAQWAFFEEQCFLASVHITDALRQTKPGQDLILDGIPIKQRAPIWARLCNVDKRKMEYPGYYDDCLLQLSHKPTSAAKDIKKDVRRTMQYHELFQTGEGIEMLTNILSVFSFKHPRIGYCQSMNLIVGALLLFFNELDAFYMFDHILSSIIPPGYYTDNMIDVKTDVQVIVHYMCRRMPDLYKKIAGFDIDLCAIVLPWLMCCYVEILPLESTMRIFDIMMVEQHGAILLRIALLILWLNSEAIMRCETQSEFLVLLTQAPSTLLDCDSLIHMAHQPLCYLTKQQVEKNRKRYKRAIEKQFTRSLKYINEGHVPAPQQGGNLHTKLGMLDSFSFFTDIAMLYFPNEKIKDNNKYPEGIYSTFVVGIIKL